MARFLWTNHARKRADEMGLNQHIVEQTIIKSENSYTQTRIGRGGQRTVHQRGKIAAVVQDERLIITVLWRTEEVYQRKK